MNIQTNVPLAAHSTMRLGGAAKYFVEINNTAELIESVSWAQANNVSVKVIGGGSNIIWQDAGFDGLVVLNKILGINVINETDLGVYISAAAGESWDDFVAHTVSLNLSGIEFLSLIPGTVGGTPIQNVGAYGSEVSQTITTVEAYDTIDRKMVIIRGSDCKFAYRESRFNRTDKGRFIITAVTFFLQKAAPIGPFYGALQAKLDNDGISQYTPAAIRSAVIAIRSAKLPDPAVIANNGSFFANPIVDSSSIVQLTADYPEIPHWPLEDGRVKLSAAWLIEQAGFKDYHDTETGMATWAHQPLVLVNEHAASTAQLLRFKETIVSAVEQKFGVTLHQEPELA